MSPVRDYRGVSNYDYNLLKSQNPQGVGEKLLGPEHKAMSNNDHTYSRDLQDELKEDDGMGVGESRKVEV